MPLAADKTSRKGKALKIGETQKVLVVTKSHNSLKCLIGNESFLEPLVVV